MIILYHNPKDLTSNSLLLFDRQILIYHSVLSRWFRLCITMASGKAHTPKLRERVHRLQLAPKATEGECVTIKLAPLKSRGLLPSRTAANPQGSFHSLRGTPAACHLPPGERLLVSSIITQIGRENKLSAEICILRTVGDAGPYKEHPYEKLRNCSFFILLCNRQP